MFSFFFQDEPKISSHVNTEAIHLSSFLTDLWLIPFVTTGLEKLPSHIYVAIFNASYKKLSCITFREIPSITYLFITLKQKM